VANCGGGVAEGVPNGTDGGRMGRAVADGHGRRPTGQRGADRVPDGADRVPAPSFSVHSFPRSLVATCSRQGHGTRPRPPMRAGGSPISRRVRRGPFGEERHPRAPAGTAQPGPPLGAHERVPVGHPRHGSPWRKLLPVRWRNTLSGHHYSSGGPHAWEQSWPAGPTCD
jgi:hypothetical protein